MSFYSRLESFPLTIKTFLLLVVLFFLYSLNYHFFDDLMPIHAWRKADALAFSWNYYQGASFLIPETNQISYFGNRNAAAEFPVVYYIVGNLWKIFGPHEWIAKMVSFSTLIGSLTLFSSVINYFLNNQIKTLVFIGLIFSSPILLFYADALLPNVFSFSFALIAGYFLFVYINRENRLSLTFFTFFLTLAVLVKVTVLISVFTFAGAAYFYCFFQKRTLFTTHRNVFITLCGVLIFTVICTFFWYYYAITYNARYQCLMFSTDIRPIWEVDSLRRREIWEIIWQRQFNLLFHHWVMIPTIIFVLYLMARNKVPSFYYWLISIGIIGVSAYILLWFWVFDVHDYYLIEVLFFPLILFFIAVKNFEFRTNLFFHYPIYIAISVLLVAVLHAISYTHISFGKDSFITKNTFLVGQDVKQNWDEIHWHHSEHLQKLQESKNELQKIIKENDTVFCLTDQSPNVDLYTIGRIGFSNYTFLKTKPYSSQIPTFIKKGARYMLVVGNEPIDPLMKQFMKDTVYAKNSVFLFDLKSYN
jgi:hypothetical protein